MKTNTGWLDTLSHFRRVTALLALFQLGPVALQHEAHGAATDAGQQAAPFTLEHLWNAPEGSEATWSAFRGSVVVLDFWATWCGPCVQGIPELNRLVKECRDLPIRFVAITDEPIEVTRRFLRDHPIDAWVGLDTDGSMVRAFGIESRPSVVVVDADGKVAAVTRPYALDREFLRAVMDGKSSQLFEPLMRLELRRSQGVSASRSGHFSERSVRLHNAGFEQILGLVSPDSDGRLDLRTPTPLGDFDLEIAAPKAADGGWRAALRNGLESMLGLSLREESRLTEVYLLEPTPGAKVVLGCASSTSRETSSPTGFVATATTLAHFASNLGIRLGRPVVDRTGISGRHRVELVWDRGDVKSMIRAVEEQLGLSLVPATIPLSYLVVEPSGANSR
ncbi:MAG: TIGR03435 family protein [Verrucomicrobiales bacterium]|nr:TIGR03435 family protein [Verrucomicrobiales bacterium]